MRDWREIIERLRTMIKLWLPAHGDPVGVEQRRQSLADLDLIVARLEAGEAGIMAKRECYRSHASYCDCPTEALTHMEKVWDAASEEPSDGD